MHLPLRFVYFTPITCSQCVCVSYLSPSFVNASEIPYTVSFRTPKQATAVVVVSQEKITLLFLSYFSKTKNPVCVCESTMACSSYLATKVGCTTCLSTLQAKKVNVEVDKASLSSSSPSFIVCTTAAEFYMQAHNTIWDNT